jgi:hypothetical protein
MSLEHAPSRLTDTGSGKHYLNSRQVRTRYGGISDMTLWRWCGDPTVAFPAPALRINRQKFWDEAALDAFDAAQAEDA